MTTFVRLPAYFPPMDNLTHTLVGAAIGQAANARRTRYGLAAVLIGANLPDIDILGLLVGQNLGFRRGITHGVPALLLWPLLLVGGLLLWERWRRRQPKGGPPLRPGLLLVLAAVAILSHPLLDWFNNYGMRWLMPFGGTWFYGDTWFIVDPWVIGVLGVALWAGKRGAGHVPNPRPARVTLGLLAGYAVLMWVGSALGERSVRAHLAALGFKPPEAVMVTPVPLNPFRRMVVVDDGQAYRIGTLSPGRPLRLRADAAIEKGLNDLDREAVMADPRGRQFLGWSRFPYARVTEQADAIVVVLDDARYSDGETGSFARTVIRLPPRR